MTGYGRKETSGAGSHFTIEVRSVNNRYIDIQVKAPRGLAVLEQHIRKRVQDRFSRGRFDVYITRNGEKESVGRLVVNETLAGQYIAALSDLRARFGLGGEVDLSLLARFQDLFALTEVKEDVEAAWQVLAEGLAQALSELDDMRAEEGRALARDISGRLETIDRLLVAIHGLAPASVEAARKRMSDALTKLLHEQPDPVRLAQEIAILAERTDVTEELTRLESHMVQFRALLADSSGEAVGRKLDFLLQEMGRETNTIASKAMDAQISLNVVNIKAELEKIREQVQNIE
jgi:uncharacterized protein (TIGR00255 family)